MQLDGYVRVSQTRGRSGDTFISPTVQRDQIERWAALREVEILKFHTDLDQSGAKTSRPGLNEALRRVEAGESGGIVVAKLDRFARSLTGALEAINRITTAGGIFVSVADGIDPSTPAGKMQQNIMLVFAEFELDRIRENWSIAQQRAVERGIHIASRNPTGYRRQGDGRLEPHPDHGQHIAEAFRMRASGDSWRTICRYLDAKKVIGPYGANHWTTRAVQHIIGNTVYLGEARSGVHVNPDGHEALIDRATWEKAQRARSAPPASRNAPALLSGLLRCAGCRFLMKPDSMKLRSGERTRIYRCRGEHSTGTCTDRPAVLGSVIEPWVERAFFDRLGDISMVVSNNEVESATGRLEAAEAELIAYRDSDGLLTALGEDRFVAGIETRARAVDAARAELLEAQGDSQLAAMAGVEFNLRELWPDIETVEKQKLLMAVMGAVMLRSGRALPIDDRALVLWGDLPDDFPRRGRRRPLVPFEWPDTAPGIGAP